MSDPRKRAIRWLIVSVIGVLMPHGTHSAIAGPAPEAVLRLETGMHTVKISRIDVDAEGRYLVTGAGDKTARVWDMPTGKLVRVLRPPIGSGDEGKVYAVAISPDGNTIAVGGWMSISDTSESIYVFDRATGKVRRRITGLPNVVFHLAFRPDGEAFAAMLGAHGIRVFRTGDGAELAQDDYGNESYGADFDRDGRLVTSCYDGLIRLYSADYKKIAEQVTPGGRLPVGVSFSPDGQYVAVGFRDSTTVNVLSGQDLSLVFEPDTRSVREGDLRQVAWSVNGQTLYAGGNAPIVMWGNAGRGTFRQLQSQFRNTIMGLKSLRGGGVVYGTWQPAIGRLDEQGHDKVLQGRGQADFYPSFDPFLVSADGATIVYQSGKQPIQFSVQARQLTLNPSPSPTLTEPLRVTSDLAIDGWNTYSPIVNGQPLKLDHFESSRSLAISHYDRSFLLGTEWYLRHFDHTGAQLWAKPVPDIAWNVNIPANNLFAVVALGDGTIRWYRLRDGEELLALFPHSDGQRWILWTPQGYYDASVGAEDLLGWHVNQGPDQEALFYPAALFREQFYRPDVISNVLKTLDVQVTVEHANEVQKAAAHLTTDGPVTATGQPRALQPVPDLHKALPPLVEFIDPVDGYTVSDSDLLVKYLLKSPTGEAVSELSGLVEGRTVTVQKEPLTIGQKEVMGKLVLRVPKQNMTIGLVAKNTHGNSEVATARLYWGARSEGPPQAVLNVLAIGISKYSEKSSVKPLLFPAKDARDVAKLLQRQKGGLYKEVNVEILEDQQATRDAILDKLEWLEKQTGPDDVAVLFLAGHGVTDLLSGEYYFLSHNVETNRPLKRTAIRGSEIRETLTTIGKKAKAFFFFDTCHSGKLLEPPPGARAESNSQVKVDAVANELATAPNGPIVFASSTGEQFSLERPEWDNGAFTKALREGLGGEADQPPDGAIDVTELERFLYRRVNEMTKGAQKTAVAKPPTMTPVPIVLVR